WLTKYFFAPLYTSGVQSLHTGCPLHAAEKALLMKLCTMCMCNAPLLHEEAQKEGRRAMEGLISLFVGDKAAVMVEVNCETDFVDVAFATMAHHLSKNQSHTGYVKCLLAAEDLSKLNLGEGASLADQLALTVDMSVKRAVTVGCTSATTSTVALQASLTWPWAIRRPRGVPGGQGRGAGHTGRKLRHPVVGEAPISLGSTDDLPCRDTETRLLAQSFLPDPSRTVAQYLTEQGARVVDFVCVQCWEAGSDGA
uniref:Elongation factor Ts n=1 Tax=Oncorhynchus kisutch TaxID=8019 RepID=A0A8C7I921_ONCKI